MVIAKSEDQSGRQLSPAILNQRIIPLTKSLNAASAYDANDVISEASTDSTGTSWIFEEVVRANGFSGTIIQAMVVSESEGVTPRLTLFLFTALPTSELDDHAGNTAPDIADIANYIGRIDFPSLDSVGTTDSNSIATPSTSGNLPIFFSCSATADDLWGVLVTRTAFTQTAGEAMTVKLTIAMD